MRIDRIVKRWDEFADDTVMVGVFDADIGDLRKRMGERGIPFTILADGDYELFTRHGVEKSFLRFVWEPSDPPDILTRNAKGIFSYDAVDLKDVYYPGGHSHWGRWEDRGGALLSGHSRPFTGGQAYPFLKRRMILPFSCSYPSQDVPNSDYPYDEDRRGPIARISTVPSLGVKQAPIAPR